MDEPALSATSQYQLVVDNPTGAGVNYVMATTTSSSPAYGSPSDTTELTVSGTLEGITRKLQGTVGQP